MMKVLKRIAQALAMFSAGIIIIVFLVWLLAQILSILALIPTLR
jgi:hypothetical protein